MSSLQTLWSVSLALAAIALIILLTLLFARTVMRPVAKARTAERQRLVELLLGEADRNDAAPARLLIGRKDLAVSLTVELLQLVQGKERRRLVDVALRMGVAERVRHLMKSGSARVRLSATEALAQFGDPASVDRLRAALTDSNAEVRFAAALSLATSGEAPPARELIRTLQIGTREHSLLAIDLFRHIAERRPVELKAVLVEEDMPSEAKVYVIEALSSSADYSLVPMIVSLAADEDDPAILARYLRALSSFGHPGAEPAVRRGLQFRASDVRAAAAEAAGRIGLLSLAPQLGQLLGDPEWWVRFRAAEALAKFGPSGAEQLRGIAANAQEPARTAASLTLAERDLA